MKKYKLIKKYPGEDNIGLEVTIWSNPNLYSATPKSKVYYKSDIEDNPEFWEEVIEMPEYVKCIEKDTKLTVGKIYKCLGNYNHGYKDCYKIDNEKSGPYYKSQFIPSTKEEYDEQNRDFEILSFKSSLGHLSRNVNGEHIFDTDDCPKPWPESDFLNNNYTIYSVKRKSDGEIFKIEDKVFHKDPKEPFIIGGFQIGRKFISNGSEIEVMGIKRKDRTMDMVCITLDRINHYEEPVFTTENGVNIFENTEYYYVDEKFNIESNKAIKNMQLTPNNKRFSTKESALDYVAMNKPCLSVKDVENRRINALEFISTGAWGRGEFIVDPEKQKEDLKEFVKNKL